MSGKYLLAIDQGTSSSRTVIYDHSARVLASAQHPEIVFELSALTGTGIGAEPYTGPARVIAGPDDDFGRIGSTPSGSACSVTPRTLGRLRRAES